MARKRSRVAVGAVGLIAVLMVVGELGVQVTGNVTNQPVSHIGCRLIDRFTPWQLEGIWCLLAPLGVLLVLAWILDGLLSRNRRY